MDTKHTSNTDIINHNYLYAASYNMVDEKHEYRRRDILTIILVQSSLAAYSFNR